MKIETAAIRVKRGLMTAALMLRMMLKTISCGRPPIGTERVNKTMCRIQRSTATLLERIVGVGLLLDVGK